MKYCPICDARYDEEIIRFCTKDGTPLVDEEQPKFVAIPSENAEETDDDIGEITVVRHKPSAPPPPPDIDEDTSFKAPQPGERIVIPTSEPSEQQVRPRTTSVYYPPPLPNTGKTVFLTILGTLVILGIGAGLFWFLQKEAPANKNVNLNANLGNVNTNLNTSLPTDSNFNFNTSGGYNTNANLNANIKTPTPTPKPSPSTSPSPSPSVSPSPSSTPKTNANVHITPSPTPRTGPRPNTMTNRPPGNHN